VGKSWIIGLLLVIILTIAALWFLGWLAFIFLTLISATMRRNFEAGLLLIPLVLDMIGIAEPIVTGGMSEWSGHPYHSPLTLMAGPIPIHFASIADFTGILAIVLIIFVRFLRMQRDQERASSELAAARSVQELMIPREIPQTPGFEVDSIYDPATEVGGDFFHIQPTGDGGLLVVIGDVAGNGLKAAMNVSMLMGALRRAPTSARPRCSNRSTACSPAARASPPARPPLLRQRRTGHRQRRPPAALPQQPGGRLPGGLPLGVMPT
jgi:HAMP domain-containing protein